MASARNPEAQAVDLGASGGQRNGQRHYTAEPYARKDGHGRWAFPCHTCGETVLWRGPYTFDPSDSRWLHRCVIVVRVPNEGDPIFAPTAPVRRKAARPDTVAVLRVPRGRGVPL